MFPKNTKVLVVDDMKTMRMVVKKALANLGFEDIQEAADGEAAWTAIELGAQAQKAFGLIVSDWTMPKMTGLDLLKKVRSTQSVKNTPFVMITAESDMAQVKEAIGAGVSNYITKPFTNDMVKAKLEQVWQNLNRKAS